MFIGIGINLNESHGFTCLAEHTDQKLIKENIMLELAKEFLKDEPLLGLDKEKSANLR